MAQIQHALHVKKKKPSHLPSTTELRSCWVIAEVCLLPYCFNLRSLQSSSSGISQLSAVHKESFVFRVYLVSAFFFFQAETVAIFVTDVLLIS